MILMRLCRATALVVFLLNFSVLVGGSRERLSHRVHCEALVKRWAENEIWAMEEAEASTATEAEEEKWRMQELLFFLHVPRTGGRNYNQCFLKNLFTTNELCPRSYDKLRIVDPSKPNCSFLSTHDDYSILARLPVARTSTITNLRDPTNRVLSAYEFSLEVGARFLKRTGGLHATRIPVSSRVQSMNTLDIWPWKYLVPLMQHDLFQRRDARASGGMLGIRRHPPNIYDAPAYTMPLKEYIEHPMVHELVHNGETFQVAGITNNSYLPEANEIRSCVTQYEELGEHVLRVAKRRLDGMLYVGLTERHKDSAQLFVHLVGRQIARRNYDVFSTENTTNTVQSYPVYGPDVTPDSTNDTEPYEDFVHRMVTAYEKCSSTIRNAQVYRRLNSFQALPLFNFTQKSRKTIPEDIMARILQLNSLDYELYQHGKKLFQKEMEYVERHTEELSKLLLVKNANTTTTTSVSATAIATMTRATPTATRADMKSYEAENLVIFIGVVILLIFLILYVVALPSNIAAKALGERKRGA